MGHLRTERERRTFQGQNAKERKKKNPVQLPALLHIRPLPSRIYFRNKERASQALSVLWPLEDSCARRTKHKPQGAVADMDDFLRRANTSLFSQRSAFNRRKASFYMLYNFRRMSNEKSEKCNDVRFRDVRTIMYFAEPSCDFSYFNKRFPDMSAANSLRVFVTGAGGFIGGSIAAGLARRGHDVVGLVRRPEQAALLQKFGIRPVVGSLEDHEVLAEQAKVNDAVVNAASAYHRGAAEALVQALDGSGRADAGRFRSA